MHPGATECEKIILIILINDISFKIMLCRFLRDILYFHTLHFLLRSLVFTCYFHICDFPWGPVDLNTKYVM